MISAGLISDYVITKYTKYLECGEYFVIVLNLNHRVMKILDRVPTFHEFGPHNILNATSRANIQTYFQQMHDKMGVPLH